MAIAEILSPLVEAALVIAPELVDVPVLGRVLIALTGGHPGNETAALEQLQRSGDTQKKTRQRVRDDLKHRVIKVSDALQCVESNIYDGRLLLNVGKALVKNIAGANTDAASLAYEPIQNCMIQKMLSQSSKKSVGGWKQTYHRPSVGHGKKGEAKPLEGEGEGKILLEKGVTEFVKGLLERR
jgi:hypothetical protein